MAFRILPETFENPQYAPRVSAPKGKCFDLIIIGEKEGKNDNFPYTSKNCTVYYETLLDYNILLGIISVHMTCLM